MRLLVVARRYWPLVGGAVTALSSLVHALQQEGARATVVTAQWDRNWPYVIEHRGARVVRLPYSAERPWAEWRYGTRLAHYVRRNAREFDLALVASLRYDAASVLSSLVGSRVPVILTSLGDSLSGELRWQVETRPGRHVRRQCLSATAYIAGNHSLGDAFRQCGYPSNRIHIIPPGVAIPPPRTEKRRVAARRMLGAIHTDLDLDDEAPLAVYVGRLEADRGLLDLVQAWEEVAAWRPQARLWLVGDGPQLPELNATLASRGLLPYVRLPGAFDSIGEVLDAADAFVSPSLRENASVALLEAMAAGLPVLAVDSPGNRLLINHLTDGLLTPPQHPRALASALRTLLDHASLAQRLGDAARHRVKNGFALGQIAQIHSELFAQLIADQRV